MSVNIQPKSKLEPHPDKPRRPINGFPPANQSNPQKELETSAHSYVQKRNTSAHFEKPKKRRKRKSEQLEQRLKAKRHIVALLRQLGYDDDAGAIQNCGEKYRILTCGDHVLSKDDFFRCGKAKLCPFCANKRSTEKIKQYLSGVESFLQNTHFQLCPLVLTQTKKPGERLSKARARIYESFRHFIRHKDFLKHFAGGIWSVETVFSDDANHCHLHISVFRRAMLSKAELAELKRAWAKASPGAKNLYLGAPRAAQEALVENLKYLTKGIISDDLTADHVSQILELRNAQMTNTFGEFRKFMKTFTPTEAEADEPTEAEADEPVEMCCVICSKTVYEQTVSAFELVELYRRHEASGAISKASRGPTSTRGKPDH
jgi:hypothetical protein